MRWRDWDGLIQGAGFEGLAWDMIPQPHHPFEFHQAMRWIPARNGHMPDAIHAI